MSRGWLLPAIVTMVLGAAGCGTPHGAPSVSAAARRSSSSASAATAHASRSAKPFATGRAGHTGRPALAGSFLMDLTWVSDQRGWALAARPCARGLCPQVAATRDGGRTWMPLPVPPGVIENGAVNCARAGCVSQLRFATTTVGYLFGPALYQTGDGGRTWHRVPSRAVEALEPSAGAVIRVVYDHTGCPGPCTRTVQETTAGSATWHTLLRIPFASADGGTAQVIRQGSSVIYIPVYGNLAAGYGQAVIFRSTDGGSSWQRLTDPCFGTGPPAHDSAALDAVRGGYLAVMCLSRTGTAAAFVLTSTDYGSSWSPPRTVPGGTRDHLTLIAAASPGRLVAATGGIGGSGPFTYRLAVSTDGGLHWSTAITGTTQISPRAPGATFLAFEDTRTGRWISDAHHIWTTRDGGPHWLQQAFP